MVTFAANKGVKRVPVSAAQFFEPIDVLRRVLVAGGHHNTPMRRGEPMSVGRERIWVQSGTRHNTTLAVESAGVYWPLLFLSTTQQGLLDGDLLFSVTAARVRRSRNSNRARTRCLPRPVPSREKPPCRRGWPGNQSSLGQGP